MIYIFELKSFITYSSMSGLSSSEENLLMSNGFSINDMKHSVNNHGMFEGKNGI